MRRRDIEAISPSGDPSQRPPLMPRPVNIGNDVWIGTGAIILKGLSVGNGATIAPGAVLTRDVPPGVLVEGNPASIREEKPNAETQE